MQGDAPGLDQERCYEYTSLVRATQYWPADMLIMMKPSVTVSSLFEARNPRTHGFWL